MDIHNKIVRSILLFLVDGAQPRNLVSSKIKNYPKLRREEAIRLVIENELIVFKAGISGKGRKPMQIRLTSKGHKLALKLGEIETKETVWSV
jgi:hypothetical protein